MLFFVCWRDMGPIIWIQGLYSWLPPPLFHPKHLHWSQRRGKLGWWHIRNLKPLKLLGGKKLLLTLLLFRSFKKGKCNNEKTGICVINFYFLFFYFLVEFSIIFFDLAFFLSSICCEFSIFCVIYWSTTWAI